MFFLVNGSFSELQVQFLHESITDVPFIYVLPLITQLWELSRHSSSGQHRSFTGTTGKAINPGSQTISRGVWHRSGRHCAVPVSGSQTHSWHGLVHFSPGFRGGLTSVQFLSSKVVRDVAVVDEIEEDICSVDEEACVVVSEDAEVKGVVEGHGP